MDWGDEFDNEKDDMAHDPYRRDREDVEATQPTLGHGTLVRK